MKTCRLFLTLLTFISFVALPGQAALTEWRTQVQVSTGSGNSIQFAFDGGLNAFSAAQSLASSGALSEATSDLNAGGFVPTLRTRATASPTRAQAVAWGVQGYQNTAATPLDTSLIVNLTANLTGANDLEGRVYLFQEENFEYSFDPGTILFESTSQLWPGFEPYANNASPTGFDILFGNYSGTVTEQRSFSFTVQPGESFYVWARLVATADNPGLVDAFSTMTASLSDVTGLVPASVPEPGSAALLGLFAVALLSGRQSRRRCGKDLPT